MKNFKGALIALGLLLALGLYIKFFEKGPAKNPDEQTGTKLFTKAVVDVQSIALLAPQDPGAEPVSLTSDAKGAWRLASPVDVEADETAVRNLLTALSECRSTVDIPAPKELSDYGLAAPRAKGVLRMKDGGTYELEVGDKNVNGSGVYVKASGLPGVHMIPNDAADWFVKKAVDFRNKKIFSVAEPTAERIRITRGSYRLTLEKSKDGSWSILEPLRAPAAADQVRSFLATVDNARAAEFPDDHPRDLTRYGLKRPAATLEVWETGSSSPKVLRVGSARKTDQKMYVQVGSDPAVYLTYPEGVKGIETKKPGDLRSKDFMQFMADQVVKLELQKGARKLSYTKDASGAWTSKDRPLAASEAPGVLAPLATTLILEYPETRADTGLANPTVTARVTLADGKVRVYRYGKRVGEDKVYLASDQGPDVLIVASYIMTQMEALFTAPAQNAAPKKKS